MSTNGRMWTEFPLSEIKFFILKGENYFVKFKDGRTLPVTIDELETLKAAMKATYGKFRTIIQETYAH